MARGDGFELCGIHGCRNTHDMVEGVYADIEGVNVWFCSKDHARQAKQESREAKAAAKDKRGLLDKTADYISETAAKAGRGMAGMLGALSGGSASMFPNMMGQYRRITPPAPTSMPASPMGFGMGPMQQPTPPEPNRANQIADWLARLPRMAGGGIQSLYQKAAGAIEDPRSRVRIRPLQSPPPPIPPSPMGFGLGPMQMPAPPKTSTPTTVSPPPITPPQPTQVPQGLVQEELRKEAEQGKESGDDVMNEILDELRKIREILEKQSGQQSTPSGHRQNKGRSPSMSVHAARGAMFADWILGRG